MGGEKGASGKASGRGRSGSGATASRGEPGKTRAKSKALPQAADPPKPKVTKANAFAALSCDSD